ncbi:MAG: hypothetical protein Q4B23_02135 [Helcococcus sp.]|nr:hypothetical protein [Helcococcus sp.]
MRKTYYEDKRNASIYENIEKYILNEQDLEKKIYKCINEVVNKYDKTKKNEIKKEIDKNIRNIIGNVVYEKLSEEFEMDYIDYGYVRSIKYKCNKKAKLKRLFSEIDYTKGKINEDILNRYQYDYLNFEQLIKIIDSFINEYIEVKNELEQLFSIFKRKKHLKNLQYSFSDYCFFLDVKNYFFTNRAFKGYDHLKKATKTKDNISIDRVIKDIFIIEYLKLNPVKNKRSIIHMEAYNAD